MADTKIIVTENVSDELQTCIKTEIESFFESAPESDFVIGLSGNRVGTI
jgi:hypothetical protein